MTKIVTMYGARRLIEKCQIIEECYIVRHPKRSYLEKHLKDSGIGTLIHYPVPPHLSDAYIEKQRLGGFFITEQMAI